MDLFTYLLAKNGNNSSVHGDLFSYLLGKGQSQTQTISGVTIYIPDAKKLVSFIMTKESTQATSILPSGYTQVNYIESDGNQYINTNYQLTSENEKVEIIYEYTGSLQNRCVFGGYDGEKQSITPYSPFQQEIVGIYVGTSSNLAPQNISINQKYNLIVETNNGNLTTNWNGNIQTITYNGNLAKNNIYLFAQSYFRDGSEDVANKLAMRCYKFKLYDNDILVRDFIPCYRNSDNEVGMYDLVNNTFYTNQGTGAFTYGSIAQLPNPDYPIEVKTVEGYRNLFDKDSALIGYVLNRNTNIVAQLDGYFTSDYCDVIPNTNYRLNMTIYSSNNYGIVYYDKNKNRLSAIAPSTSFTTPENCYYIRFTCRTNTDINILQLTKGDQELPYVPYGNNYVNVTVSDGTNTNNYPIPLNNNEIVGIGDYKDELLVDKSGHVFINKKTGKVVLNGSENWFIQNRGTEVYSYRLGIQAIKNYSKNYIFCNYYPVINSLGNTDTNQGLAWMYGTATTSQIRIRWGAEDTLENFKAWLSTHNTEVYYVLATPEPIDLQTTVDLKLFKGVNNVSNSVDGYMTIEYK